MFKEQKVLQIFNTIAPKYDLVNTILSLGCHHYWRKAAIGAIHPKNGDRLLDLCCGTGMFTLELAKRSVPLGKVTGLDFSESMLTIAAGRLRQYLDNNQVELVHGDALALPFDDRRFDGITIGYGLRNVADIQQFLREVYRVLKPGGTVVSLEMGRPCGPVLRHLYYLYLTYWIPFAGKLFADAYESYCYLHDSIMDFPLPHEIVRLFGEVGFGQVDFKRLTGGIAILYQAAK